MLVKRNEVAFKKDSQDSIKEKKIELRNMYKTKGPEHINLCK